jgi:hypothetical protein
MLRLHMPDLQYGTTNEVVVKISMESGYASGCERSPLFDLGPSNNVV